MFQFSRCCCRGGAAEGGLSVPGTAYSELTVRLVEKVTVGALFCLSFCLRRYSSSRANSRTTRSTSTTMPAMAPHESLSPGGRGTMTLPTCSSEPDTERRKRSQRSDGYPSREPPALYKSTF